jgi:hypothetical protein
LSYLTYSPKYAKAHVGTNASFSASIHSSIPKGGRKYIVY